MQISKIFTIAARIEAMTWAGLLIGMYFKYGLELTEIGVWLFGRLHGAADPLTTINRKFQKVPLWVGS